MSIDVSVRDAKARLSELLDKVEKGEEVRIRRHKKPIARLVPEKPTRQPGRLKGQIWIADDFDQTPEDLFAPDPDDPDLMRLLLDTCALIWWQADHPRIQPHIETITRAEEVHISIVSMLEIAVKIGIGKLQLDLMAAFDALRADNFDLLPLQQSHLARQLALPQHHKDPFDRAIIAQAQTERMTVMTADRRYAAYDIDLLAIAPGA